MSTSQLLIVLAAVVAGSIAKAVTGMGLPIIVIPIASLFVSLDDAVVTIALPNVVANGILAYRERSALHDAKHLGVLALSGIAGAVAGSLLFIGLPEEPLVAVLVLAIVGYVLTFLLTPDLQTSERTARRWSPAAGALAGAFQGSIGISGPIVGSWIHSFRLPRSAHILSVTSLFFITGVTQLTVFAAHGELDGRVGATLAACVPVVASIPIGTALRNRISVRAFDLAIVGMLFVSAVALLLRTFA